MKCTNADLVRQLRAVRGNGLFAMLSQSAGTHGLPVAYVLAVASRETNLTNILGDGGHGVGIMQIDIRSHKEAREAKVDGSWRTHPERLIEVGCALLAANRDAARHAFPTSSDAAHLKIAASGYNCGIGVAVRAGQQHNDSDFHTTGGDYGRDVMARMAAFDALLKGGK